MGNDDCQEQSELTGYGISDIAELAGVSMQQVLDVVSKLKIKSGSRCEEVRLFDTEQVEAIMQELKS